MPRNHTELLDELTKRVDALTVALEGVRTASTVEIAHIKDGLRDVQALLKDMQQSGTKLLPGARLKRHPQQQVALVFRRFRDLMSLPSRSG